MAAKRIWGVVAGGALLILTLVLCSCTTNRGHYLPPAQVSGEWSGTWRSATGVAGNLGVNFNQYAGQAAGSIAFSGSPCFSGGEVAGDVDGSLFTGALRAGGVHVDLSGTVTGDQMNGTYRTVSAGVCTGDVGTFSMVRSSSRSGPSTTTSQPDPRLVEGWQRFMAANPELKDWEFCTLKVAMYGGVQTLESLRLRASQLCIPAERWKFVAQNDSGVRYFVDPDTVTLREGAQVDLWTLSDVSVDDSVEPDDTISTTARSLFNCDHRTMTVVSILTKDANGNVTTQTPSVEWVSVPPASLAENLLDLGCTYREAVMSGASGSKRPKAKVRTVEKVRPPTQQEIQQALKVYLQGRYGF